MHADATLIDEIVKRVLSQLGTVGAAAPTHGQAIVKLSSSVETPEVSLDSTIVTQELLEQKVGGANRVQVTARAILTPSARDFIRQRGLTVVRAATSSAIAQQNPWLVLVTKAAPDVGQSLDSLRAEGFGFTQQLLGQPQEVADRATSAICRGESPGVIVISDVPELVACLANRNDRVRAGVVSDIAALSRVRAGLQPNLLAIDPAGRNAFELRQLLKALMKA